MNVIKWPLFKGHTYSKKESKQPEIFLRNMLLICAVRRIKRFGKNGKIKKIGCLGAYSFVLFLFAFDCLYFWVSQKRQVVHYNKLTECFYGKHVTYLSGIYFLSLCLLFSLFFGKRKYEPLFYLHCCLSCMWL